MAGQMSGQMSLNGRPSNGRPSNGRPSNGRSSNGRSSNGRSSNGRSLNKGLTSALGALSGIVAVLAMIRLVAGAGFTSVLAWGFLLAAMLPWIGYCGWRAGRGALRPRAALAVLALSLVGLGCVWLFTLGPVVALICSFAAFVIIWVHDWPTAPARGETQYVRVDDLTAGEADVDQSIDPSRTAA